MPEEACVYTGSSERRGGVRVRRTAQRAEHSVHVAGKADRKVCGVSSWCSAASWLGCKACTALVEQDPLIRLHSSRMAA